MRGEGSKSWKNLWRNIRIDSYAKRKLKTDFHKLFFQGEEIGMHNVCNKFDESTSRYKLCEANDSKDWRDNFSRTPFQWDETKYEFFRSKEARTEKSLWSWHFNQVFWSKSYIETIQMSSLVDQNLKFSWTTHQSRLRLHS